MLDGAPHYVEEFVGMLITSLSLCHCDVSEPVESPDGLAVTFDITGDTYPASLILHQTARSIEAGTHEYRVRCATKLPDPVFQVIRGKETMYNRFVATGGLVTSNTGVESCCQTLLNPGNISVAAILIGFEISQGCHAVPGTIRQAMRIDEPVGEQPSAWEQPDFELLHYEYAFLGTGRLRTSGWVLGRLDAQINVDAIEVHPCFGGGLQTLLRVPKQRVGYAAHYSINRLNQVAFLFGNSPYLGAWCDDGDDLCFTSFIPNHMKGVPGLESELVAASVMREKELSFLVTCLADSSLC